MSINALAEYERQGKTVICREGDLDGDGELAISTGLAQIDAVSVNIRSATAPTTDELTWDFADGVVTIYGWDGGVASAGEETVSVTIIGRRRE